MLRSQRQRARNEDRCGQMTACKQFLVNRKSSNVSRVADVTSAGSNQCEQLKAPTEPELPGLPHQTLPDKRLFAANPNFPLRFFRGPTLRVTDLTVNLAAAAM